MSCQQSSAAASPQFMVDQRPAYDRKWGRRRNQVVGRKGGKIIRPDKRYKTKYL